MIIYLETGSMDCPKISIIVAVYKAEAYLHRCVDSLLAQTFQEFEILLIDDGSPDHSGKICDDYAKQDARIRVFHKENGGVSSARQCGMEHVRGEYVIHADPDDWVEPNMLEELYAKAKEIHADMVICDFWKEYHNHVIYSKQKPTSLEVRQVLRDLCQDKLYGSLCNKLIHAKCYEGITFPIGMNYTEDRYICILLLLQTVNSISYLNRAFYHYDKYSNSNSATSHFTFDVYLSNKQYWINLKNYFIDRQDFYYLYNNVIITLAYDCFRYNVCSAFQYYNEFNDKILCFLRAHSSLKVKICTILCVMGLKPIIYRLYLYLKKLE